jgi:hypothetical protein
MKLCREFEIDKFSCALLPQTIRKTKIYLNSILCSYFFNASYVNMARYKFSFPFPYSFTLQKYQKMKKEKRTLCFQLCKPKQAEKLFGNVNMKIANRD